MMRRQIPISILFLLPAAVAVVWLAAANWPKQKPASRVCFGQRCFKVELALTPSEWSRGLMDRPKLSQDEGMLFIMDEEKGSSFWMKNMRFPLDIIWFDQDSRIIFISKNNPPCGESCAAVSPGPGQRVKYVLEINAGLTESFGLAKGDRMELDIFR